MNSRGISIIAAVLCICVCLRPAVAQERKFSFIHMSDVHITPYQSMPSDADLVKGRSYNVVQTVKALDTIRLDPYSLVAPKPSFMIVTGDVTEFGYPGATWQVAQKYFGGLGIPVCLTTGNHDNTWVSVPDKLKSIGNGLNYSFDHQGIHFAMINTSTLQSPSPSIDEASLNFLRSDFAKLAPGTPIIVGFHHPLSTTEFCSEYDTDRLLDVLHDYNVVLILYGHGHGASHDVWGGIDAIQGGSPFSNDPKSKTQGYGIVMVHGDKISAAYKTVHDSGARKGLLQKSISKATAYPKVTIESPQPFQQLQQPQLSLKATVEGGFYNYAWYELDDETSSMLQLRDGTLAMGPVNLAGLKNGAHFLRLNYRDRTGKMASRSTCFFLDVPGAGAPVAKWRFRMGGSSKATPLVASGRVFVGSNDCKFYALDAASGQLAWQIDVGGEVVSSAIAHKDTVLFGTGGGQFMSVGMDGKPRWSYPAGAGVFSSPVLDGEGTVFFGTNGGDLVALNADTGQMLWKNEDPEMSIESNPFVAGDFVYCGAWDGYLYAMDRKTGKTAWKTPGSKAQTSAKTYYAPGDNGPVATQSGVFVADRGYELGKYSLDGKYQGKIGTGVASISLAADGSGLYVRGSTPFAKIDENGKAIWTTDIKGGTVPISPLDAGGAVLVCTNSGTLHALRADNGTPLWQYQVTPKLFVMSGQAVANGMVYTTGFDGMVTAIGN